MKTIEDANRISNDQIVARYAESLQGEFERLEATDAINHPAGEIGDSPDTQIVAPWDGSSSLKNSDFFRVKYETFNAKRISFWIGKPPTTAYYAVIFKAEKETVILKAHVVQSKLDSSQAGASYLVMAEFAEKIDTKNVLSH